MKPEDKWKDVPTPMAAEILRLTEEGIRSQWQSAIAADQRAMQVLAATTTLAAGVVAATAALVAVDKWSWPLVLGAGAWELVLMAAIGCAAYAARPIEFHHPGSRPSLWGLSDFSRPLSNAFGGQAEAYERCIEKNHIALVANGVWLKRAMWLFGASPITAGAIASVAWAVAAVEAQGVDLAAKAVSAVPYLDCVCLGLCTRAAGP
jgi:hypothetical protein